MYASSTHAAEYIARRERLGIPQTKPIAASPIPPRVRDVIRVEQQKDTPMVMGKTFANWPVPQALMWKQIAAEVCEAHGVSMMDLISARRDRKTAAARAEACYRMRKETKLSLPQIGQKLGGRDHTTILHNIRRFEAKLNGEEYRKRPLSVITANIKGDENGNVELG